MQWRIELALRGDGREKKITQRREGRGEAKDKKLTGRGCRAKQAAEKLGETFLQGLKPIGAKSLTPGLKPRPPREKDVASAGPNFQACISSGKFQGII